VAFALRQLHSLAGVVPVGAFMLLALWANAKAADGPRAFEEALGWMARTSWPVQALIAVPLLFHAGYGVWLSVRSEYNLGRYAYSRNGSYVLQRATGLAALGFIGVHYVRFWLPLATEHATLADLQERIVRTLSATWLGAPVAAVAYVLGIAACAFHLGNGLRNFAVRWGLAPLGWQRRAASAAGAIVGLAALAIGGHTVLAVATGWRIVDAAPKGADGRCGIGAPSASTSTTSTSTSGGAP
jgi:succinate dehydrogenase / fumarate reductase cytochrome b subunit